MAIDFGNTDYQALTQQLVAAERAQRTQTVVAKAELYGEKVDAFASLRTTVNSLGTAASKLDSSLDFRNFNVDYSDAGYVNVTTSGSSPPSNLSVEVLQVGRPDQALASFNQAGGTDNGDGSVTISVGGESFSVSLS
ncbi:MAG: flagellar cap protein FliD N-terminal domain-containing protein, partial [Litorivicinus sp.]